MDSGEPALVILRVKHGVAARRHRIRKLCVGVGVRDVEGALRGGKRQRVRREQLGVPDAVAEPVEEMAAVAEKAGRLPPLVETCLRALGRETPSPSLRAALIRRS
jgi:hypothetical protein